jgi:hypothetical protein
MVKFRFWVVHNKHFRTSSTAFPEHVAEARYFHTAWRRKVFTNALPQREIFGRIFDQKNQLFAGGISWDFKLEPTRWGLVG